MPHICACYIPQHVYLLINRFVQVHRCSYFRSSLYKFYVELALEVRLRMNLHLSNFCAVSYGYYVFPVYLQIQIKNCHGIVTPKLYGRSQPLFQRRCNN